ncbi:MAG: ribulokinase [Armatimonadetes bacterium]|nr:ribulokinase [Armatimonadota bacterium]
MSQYALGVDYGTNSVRALVVDVSDGSELGTAVAEYSTGDQGVLTDPNDPNLARQDPRDYLKGFFECVPVALKEAGIDPGQIVGLGVDTTGSTPMPVDQRGVPLAFDERFQGNPDAMAWLWKDHTAHAEAAEITELANARGEPYTSKCGGTYSSEWFWSKILHCARVAPEVFAAADSWVEAQDCIPAWLCGVPDARSILRGVCAAGHKAMFHESWGGLPSVDFLSALDPRLGDLRDRLYSATRVAGDRAGGLDAEIASKVGLPSGLAVSVGAMDAHLGAVGSGVKPGTLVKIMGTSTCDIMVGDESTPDIPGVCGIVPGSVIPGMMGIEAGQSAVGDLFNWCVGKLETKGHQELADEASQLLPGESGLLALDWNNGNRTVLVDPLLTGLLVGQTLHTTEAHIYRALIEATAFGARKIIERIEEFGVTIDEVVVCGGIAEKSPLTMQIYADVCGRPMKLSRSGQTCALGAAIMGSVAGGAHGSVLQAVGAMTGAKDTVYAPEGRARATYDRLYGLYTQLHDAFGTNRELRLGGVMKELIKVRDESRKGA